MQEGNQTMTTESKPTIHLNGTSAKSLLDANRDALQAVQDAMKKLQQAAPHARDFYVKNQDAYKQARDEHIDRVRLLENVMTDLETICIHVIDHTPRN